MHWLEDPAMEWVGIHIAFAVRDAVIAAFTRSEEILLAVSKEVNKYATKTPPDTIVQDVEQAILLALAGTIPLELQSRGPKVKAEERVDEVPYAEGNGSLTAVNTRRRGSRRAI